MASLPLGLARATKGGAEVTEPGQTWQGTKDIAGGAVEAATIPSAFMGGPAADTGAEAAGTATSKLFGNVEKAGKLFDEVSTWQFVKRAAPTAIGVGAGGRMALSHLLDYVGP